jgi:hypothetical protein
MDAKRQANVEQRSIPQGASLPPARKETQLERIKRLANELGI